jgi:pilus assembly protein CpaF
VGEVRGAEVVDLLSALNTGHEGGCGTVHANSAADVPARLEALGLTAGLPRIAVHSLVAAGLDAVIHLQRDDTGHRRVRGIHVTEGDADGFVHTVPALEFDSAGATIIGPGMERLTRRLQGA